MKAYFLNKIYDLKTQAQPLEMVDTQVPVPKEDEILIKVSCCGICHTELDEIEGRTPPPSYPIIPGHQVIGIIDSLGIKASCFKKGERVGVAWIFSACGKCDYCKNEMENLCAEFKATGRDANGGYAEYMTVRENFAYKIPDSFSDAEAAPLLCAGAIGYRSLKLANIKDGRTLGLTGFGASGHLVLKMAKYILPHSHIIVFARDREERAFALSLGASWAGDINEVPPYKAHSIIDTTPVWNTIVKSLLYLEPGGRLVINAIRKEPADKSALLDIDYPQHLWMEKEIKSVANITRNDVQEFLQLAARIPIKPEIEMYPFEQANKALLELKNKRIKGAKVLQISK